MNESSMKNKIIEHEVLQAYNSGGVANKTEVNLKVDKVTGKWLSTNDYDNTEKGKVAQNTADIASLTQQKGTTQTLTFNTDGTVQKVTDTDAQSNVVRESVFTYPDTYTIVEVKTVGTNVTTYTYRLDTLETEVS